MSFSDILPPSLWFYLQFGDGGSAAGPAYSQQMCEEFHGVLFPRPSLGKSVTAAVLRGAAPAKSSPQSCPEHVPASWEPAGAGQAAAALGNQLWLGQSPGCSSGPAALGLPQVPLPLVTSVTVSQACQDLHKSCFGKAF